MTSVVWLGDAARKWWDQALLLDLLNGELWRPPGFPEFKHFDELGGVHGAVVVVPGAYYVDRVDELNEQLGHLDWVLLVVTGDEAALFPWAELVHSNMIIWRQTPWVPETAECLPESPARAVRYLPVGYQPGTREKLTEQGRRERSLQWFFAGQITHDRRFAMASVLQDNVPGGELLLTEGFTQGWPQDEYLAHMAETMAAPCPSGPNTVDTFRLCEALEAGCVPLVDSQTPEYRQTDLWDTMFAGHEMVVIDDWKGAPGHIRDIAHDWPRRGTRVGAWWMRWKRRAAYQLRDDVVTLSGAVLHDEPSVTVVVTTSPCDAPMMDNLDETIASARHHLPGCEIIVAADGIRPEQEHLRGRYEEYLNLLVWRCQREWTNVLPLVSDEWRHQANLTMWALDHVHTPLIMFMEHDTPLVDDELIEWDVVREALLNGDADVVRFHHEAQVLKPHEHLMIDHEFDKTTVGRRTVQWSQRPHMSTLAYYREMLHDNFDRSDRTMIEDVMHGVVQQAWDRYGMQGWYRHRLWIYDPGGTNMKRSYHLDGRGDEDKYQMLHNGEWR